MIRIFRMIGGTSLWLATVVALNAPSVVAQEGTAEIGTMAQLPSDAAEEAILWTNADAEHAWVPNMLGDFIGGFSFKVAPGPVNQPRAVARAITRFKVADNNSPLPRTRLLYSYNYFHDPFQTRGDLSRHFYGVEYGVAEWASFEIKNSINSYNNFVGFSDKTDISDLQTTLKILGTRAETYALSGGLAVGAPIANMPSSLSNSNWIFAPFAAGLWTPRDSRIFTQGFMQLDIPTVADDVVLLHTDVGVGYFLFNDPTRFVSMIAPTVELHAYTPIGGAGGVYQDLNYVDVLNLTVGTTFRVREFATLAVGGSFPMSTQKDYDFEIQAHVNWFFRSGR